ncbi:MULTISPECIES: TM2 domain-containing protein [Listeria]|uniref:TM2 domain-containing protein n=1 Tax=Listeria swaminathanii TaxID=2713501 RepID=A0A7X1A3F4_9LIST|nr:TM2 domain-containing protein [Listeria marthii]MBC2330442.1 TM2 domain-containing protein [Listeria swaminathanii]MDT0000730.1 TM2 domain-containing protein [Listeria cossartiae subsp. cayugensis]MBC2102643.1 TM2 domain-containing protein [Listeria marthii]MBC2123067.1 TM2 domain-containing protein [Listeria marthii]
MAKVIKIEDSSAIVLKDNGETIDVSLTCFTFSPDTGDEVEVYKHGEELIVNKKVEKTTENPNINIVNNNSQNQDQAQEQAQTQTQTQTVVTEIRFSQKDEGKLVNKWVYVALALLLGTFGAHKFLAGKNGQGVLYVVFCWTGIPSIVSFIEGIVAIFKKADANNEILIQ